MDEMLGYIFGRIKTYEDALSKINRSLKCQDIINRRFWLFSTLAAVNSVVMCKHILEQNKKIRKLSEEIEKMKGSNESDSTESES